jgi:hypothetical protein
VAVAEETAAAQVAAAQVAAAQVAAAQQVGEPVGWSTQPPAQAAFEGEGAEEAAVEPAPVKESPWRAETAQPKAVARLSWERAAAPGQEPRTPKSRAPHTTSRAFSRFASSGAPAGVVVVVAARRASSASRYLSASVQLAHAAHRGAGVAGVIGRKRTRIFLVHTRGGQTEGPDGDNPDEPSKDRKLHVRWRPERGDQPITRTLRTYSPFGAVA